MHKWQYIPPHSRFATRQSNLGYTLGNEERGKVDYFGSGKKMGGRRERYAFLGHAIQTSQVATLGDTDTQIVMLAVIGVGQE